MHTALWGALAVGLAVLLWLDVGRRRQVAARRAYESARRQLALLLRWRARAVARLDDAPLLALGVQREAQLEGARWQTEAEISEALRARPWPNQPDLYDVCARLEAHGVVYALRAQQLVAARRGLRGRFLARTFAPSAPAPEALDVRAPTEESAR